jgi:hypothetical protein
MRRGQPAPTCRGLARWGGSVSVLRARSAGPAARGQYDGCLPREAGSALRGKKSSVTPDEAEEGAGRAKGCLCHSGRGARPTSYVNLPIADSS